MGDIYVWLLSFLFLMGLLFIIVFQLMCLSELESDYINPYDSARRINAVTVPEFAGQGVLGLFYLLTGHWLMALLCAPYTYHNFRLYNQRKHKVDVTEIYNMLQWEKRQRLFKLGYCIFLLLLSVFWLIYNVWEDVE